MANEVLRKIGDQICFCDTDSFNPTAANDLRVSPTEVNLWTDGLATGAAAESDKVNLGARRAPAYSVRAAIQMATTSVVAGENVSFYWASSSSATAASANPGGTVGGSGLYTGTALSTVAESVVQLDFIGQLILTEDYDTTVQVGAVGTFSPRHRYGSLVVVNNSADAFYGDAEEHHVVFDPIIDEVQ